MLRELMKIKLTHGGSLSSKKLALKIKIIELYLSIQVRTVSSIIGNHSLLLILFHVQINADDDADDMVKNYNNKMRKKNITSSLLTEFNLSVL